MVDHFFENTTKREVALYHIFDTAFDGHCSFNTLGTSTTTGVTLTLGFHMFTPTTAAHTLIYIYSLDAAQ